MSDRQDMETASCNPEPMPKIRLLSLRLRNNWFFLKQRIRVAWWPNKIRQLDRERADWKRWCIDAETDSELLESAWGLIANAYDGNWDEASEASGWKVAAERWRDKYRSRFVDEES